MKIIDLIIAIIFTVVAVLEAFGVFACWKVRTAALAFVSAPPPTPDLVYASARVFLQATHRMIRMFSFASIAAAALATGGGVLAFAFDFVRSAVASVAPPDEQLLIHLLATAPQIFKNDLKSRCERDATTTGVTLRTGWWWDSAPESKLTAGQAAVFCRDKWTRGMWGDLILVAAIIFLASVLRSS